MLLGRRHADKAETRALLYNPRLAIARHGLQTAQKIEQTPVRAIRAGMQQAEQP
jgi:hypothetical protein